MGNAFDDFIEHVVGGSGNEGLDEMDAEEAKKVDERSDQRQYRGHFS